MTPLYLAALALVLLWSLAAYAIRRAPAGASGRYQGLPNSGPSTSGPMACAISTRSSYWK
ncbi:hypothetical protein GCM10009549_45880 [Streptomyces thermoalcalitolerans]|uniref:Uncharacterized protein n=1 Tax=Streptomyces thermoalcalitolerans TaxID=65605 RepID=A0ABN1PB56_9ACTN